MRKLITSILIASIFTSTPVLAHGRYDRDHYQRIERNEQRNRSNWVAPLLGGIIIGTIIGNSNNRNFEDRFYNPYALDLDTRYYNPRCATEQFTDRYGVYYRRICQ